jgi:hypothetical protein
MDTRDHVARRTRQQERSAPFSRQGRGAAKRSERCSCNLASTRRPIHELVHTTSVITEFDRGLAVAVVLSCSSDPGVSAASASVDSEPYVKRHLRRWRGAEARRRIAPTQTLDLT